jgi:hypothetical protein
MTIEEIAHQGLELGWSRAQMLYVQDIVNNALVPIVYAQHCTSEQIDAAVGKLKAMVTAITLCAHGARAPKADPAGETVCMRRYQAPCVCGTAKAQQPRVVMVLSEQRWPTA